MPNVVVRVALAYLAVAGLFPGVWATVAPRNFYDDFPGGGLRWVAAEPPYNEHLVRDVGAFFLALGILALVAAILSNVTLARVTGAVWLVFSIPHLAFHVRHLDRYDSAALNVLALSLPIAAALVALVGPSRTRRPAGQPPPT